jgi:hypothetical protein
MLQGNEPQIIRRDNAYSVKKQFGDIYDCIVTSVLNDGRIYVHVPDLGSDLGPILPLSTDITNKYSVNDTVVGTFMTSAMTSFVIFGSSKARKRSSIVIFATEEERTNSLELTPSSSFFTYVLSTGNLEVWNGTTWVQFIGPTGPAGPAGPAGPTGATGSTGPTGIQGDWATPQSIRSVTSSTDTPTSSDRGRLININTSSGAVTITINGSLDLTIGVRIDFAWIGAASSVTFAESGATIYRTPGLKLRTRYSTASLICVATDTYLLAGDLSA